MEPTKHFPGYLETKVSLSNNELLNTDDYKSKGITETVVRVAAKIFADQEMPLFGVKIRVMTMVYDFKHGKNDEFNKITLAHNFIRSEPSDLFWDRLAGTIYTALIECPEAQLKPSDNDSSDDDDSNVFFNPFLISTPYFQECVIA
jgi:hypothetical protein